jgi:hypothetical protein
MNTRISKLNSVIIAAVISMSGIVAWSVSAREQTSTTGWEYKAVTSRYGTDPVDLNALGAEGWELVAVTSVGKVSEQGGFYGYYFKRRK